jgi:hypothetical protein
MDTKILVVGIVFALVVGAGAGYLLAPESVSSPELEGQIEEYQSNIRTLENEKSDLQTSLSNTMSTNTALQASVTSLESENTELRDILKNATALFESIEEKLDMFESGFGSPIFDSGWLTIDPGETKAIEHGLGTTEDLFVYVIGRYYEGQTNQLYYGLGFLDDVEIGNGWTMDDTFISITRGVADVHWDETRVNIWRIPQGQAGQTSSTETSSVMDVKYVEINLSAEDIDGNYERIIDLDGYKEITISWYLLSDVFKLSFDWVIKENGDYLPVGLLFVAEPLALADVETSSHRFWTGSDSFKIGSKYLRIKTYGAWEKSDILRIVIIATK